MSKISGRKGIWADMDPVNGGFRAVRTPDMPTLLAVQGVKQNAMPTPQAMRRAAFFVGKRGHATSVLIEAFTHPATVAAAREAGLPCANGGSFNPRVASRIRYDKGEALVNRAI